MQSPGIDEDLGDEIDLNGPDEEIPQNNETQEPAAFVPQVVSNQNESLAESAILEASIESKPASIPVSPPLSSSTPNNATRSPSIPETGATDSSNQMIEIKVEEPKRVGDGYSSFITYKVSTKTNLSYFRRNSFSVNRRFSDFRGLRDKLVQKHLHAGRIIPPAPEKDAVGTAKVKMSKDEDFASDEFIERRRSSLERFLNRTAAHPVLRADPDFREFLELDTDLPKVASVSSISPANWIKKIGSLGENINKMTFRMDESDPVSNPL